jgi:hypothetical protein
MPITILDRNAYGRRKGTFYFYSHGIRQAKVDLGSTLRGIKWCQEPLFNEKSAGEIEKR